MSELFIPVVLELDADHCQRLRHRVIYTFHPTVAIWVVGAGGYFPNPWELFTDVRKLGAELDAVVQEEAARASLEGNVPIDKNVSRALSDELSHCDFERAGSAAETNSEKQDVGMTSRHHVSPNDYLLKRHT